MSTDILLQRGWLARQPEVFQLAVLSGGNMRRYERNATIYLQGDPPGGVFAIVAGSLSVAIAPGESGPHLAHLAAPGSWFGEGCFLTGEPRRVGLMAMQESVLFYLPLEVMERIANDDPVNIRRFAHIAIFNLDLALRVVNDLLIPGVEPRIAAVLLRLQGATDQQPMPLSQAELGRLANVSRKVVNRTLNDFQRRGWIKSGYASIQILERSRLEELAATG